MDLNTVIDVQDARSAGQWRAGDAWLAGGTYLYSEPQPQLRRLLDLATMGWPSLRGTVDGLEIGATCTISELVAFAAPPEWVAWPLVAQCARSFLASFKIWNTATVGGNICNSLPAGPMISLTAALDGECTLLDQGGGRRILGVSEFVTGAGRNALLGGELLRSVSIPRATLASRTAFRQGSLYRNGRSAALVIGRLDPATRCLTLTVTASTPRPVVLEFGSGTGAGALRDALDSRLPLAAYFDDIHGRPEWRRHLTMMFAEQIRAELLGAGPGTGAGAGTGTGADAGAR
jgi:CO/xanthine dehydrogenase FAD-binding subunit